MSRALVAGLSGFALSGLSCAVLSTGPAALPPVDAGPPALAREAPATATGDPFVAIALDVLRSHRTGLTEEEVEKLAHVIVAEARHHRLDPGLVLAVMSVESRYDSFAVSPVGAMGLMQVMPATGEEVAGRLGVVWYGPHTLFDPFVNVRLGIAYLRELSDRYGRLSTALAAYNWGPGRIDRRLRLGTPMPEEYPRLVLEAYGEAPGKAS